MRVMSFKGSRRGGPGGDHPPNRVLNKTLIKAPIDNNRLPLEGIQWPSLLQTAAGSEVTSAGELDGLGVGVGPRQDVLLHMQGMALHVGSLYVGPLYIVRMLPRAVSQKLNLSQC